jgi:hypothetical protein
MKMSDRHFGLTGLFLLVFLVGGCIGWYLKPCPCDGSKPVIQSLVDVRVDSVPYEVEIPKVMWRSIRSTDTVYRDTGRVYTTPAFTAELDTTIDQDTAKVRFRWPEQEFDLYLSRPPSSVMLPQTTITLTNTVYERRPWWMDVLTHVGAATVGYGVGTLTR